MCFISFSVHMTAYRTEQHLMKLDIQRSCGLDEWVKRSSAIACSLEIFVICMMSAELMGKAEG